MQPPFSCGRHASGRHLTELAAACLAAAMALVCIVALTATTGGVTTAAPAPEPALAVGSQMRIMPLGDSLTVGEGAGGDGWRLPLAQYMLDVQHWPAEWVGGQTSGSQPNPRHEGHSGWRIDQLAARAAEWVTTWQPDLVIIQAGTNDAIQGASGEVMLARMRDLIAIIRGAEPDAAIIVADLIPVRYGTDRDIASVAMQDYNAGLAGLAASAGGGVVVAHLSRIPNRLLADGIHPVPEGYRHAAWIIYRCMGVLTGGTIRSGEDVMPVSIPTTELCE